MKVRQSKGFFVIISNFRLSAATLVQFRYHHNFVLWYLIKFTVSCTYYFREFCSGNKIFCNVIMVNFRYFFAFFKSKFGHLGCNWRYYLHQVKRYLCVFRTMNTFIFIRSISELEQNRPITGHPILHLSICKQHTPLHHCEVDLPLKKIRNIR